MPRLSEPLSILGASGAGKTMLLRMHRGTWQRPDRGRIKLNDRLFFDSQLHPQHPCKAAPRRDACFRITRSFRIAPWRRNIAFGLEGLPARERSKRVSALIERTDYRAWKAAFCVRSHGGEQQRVALARCPRDRARGVCLWTEPLSALAHKFAKPDGKYSFGKRLRRFVANVSQTNTEEAYRLGVMCGFYRGGRVVASGAKGRTIQRPPR